MRCISALPGRSASRAREVVAPYSTARPAQNSAMTTPWSVKNELKGMSFRRSLAGSHGSGRTRDPGQERAQEIGRGGGPLYGPGAKRLALLCAHVAPSGVPGGG